MIPLLLIVCALLAPSTLAFYDNSDVVELTESNFDRLVVQSDEIWVVEFYAEWCGHCQQLKPEYKKLASALKGVIKVGAVNADDQKSLSSQYSVRGFPTIKIFGANKRTPNDYNGQRTAQGIADAALAEAKSKVSSKLSGSSSGGGGGGGGGGSCGGGGGGGAGGGAGGGSAAKNNVIELTDANFDTLVLQSEDVWLVEFFAPWCGHCKSLEPEWAKAAAELKGKVKLGALDATAHQAKAAEYSVRGYPTIKFFAGGKKTKSDATDFDGGRTSADIVAWALERYTDSIPAPEVVELTSEAVAKKTCDNKPLCIVSVLPHILDCDSKCRNDYLKILQNAANSYKKNQWGWLWAQGGSQQKVEEALEIGGFGYPAMSAVNYKKMKFTSLRGSFSKEGINEFLRDISFGRGQTAPVRGAEVPKIYETQPWDGKDGQLPEEEDIDLSDVDLDDKDEL